MLLTNSFGVQFWSIFVSANTSKRQWSGIDVPWFAARKVPQYILDRYTACPPSSQISVSWYFVRRLNDWCATLASGSPTLLVNNVVFAGETNDFVTSECISTSPPNTLHLSVILPPTPRSIPWMR